MALREHLAEARNRLFKALIALALATVAGFFFYDEVLDLLFTPVLAAGGSVNYAAVMSPFDIMLKVSLFIGLVLSSPVWLYQLWAFIVPGLKKNERRLGYSFAAAAVPLFLGGVAMAYYVLPFALQFFVGLAPENSEMLLTIDNYLPFIFRLLLAFGLAMLVPVLMVGLNMVGVLPARLILKNWRITVFLIALVAAMAAPGGDAITMFALAGPLFLTFAAATLICYLNDRKRSKKLAEQEAENERLARGERLE
ncbi:twin-arginine translocase subunit TatC [Glutamicibacter creatinolyticus]|uniref:Sec-independent protein translocase protein TatC n=1 Tax=Glutamicibacter creatinolyticus TaxID=162496 RepID=A0A5B7WSU5_9MICC|nr:MULTISPECIES: twin-arginine translocase subunit TatC [Micrococcaceae]QCY47148.1 Sec-independent protein translocase protein TatCy [Glutamicibacter creatinolyticus]TLK56593.1 twin-arginine translocase subunit TatC [Glutamicibacter sp. V16R2B1]